MRSRMLRWAPYAVVGLVAGLCSRAPAATETLAQYWDKELVRLQGWPAQVERDPSMITFCAERLRTCQMRWHMSTHPALRPVLYLLDRQDPTAFAPGADHTWVALDVRELCGTAALTQHPNPEQQEAHAAVLAAVRAFDVLAGLQRTGGRRCGLVGEGLGATLALAVAALRPEQTAFVAAHKPLPAAHGVHKGLERWARQADEAGEYVAPEQFARLVTAPALVSVGEAGGAAEAEGVYEALGGPRELMVIPSGRRGPTDELRQWERLWREWADGLRR